MPACCTSPFGYSNFAPIVLLHCAACGARYCSPLRTVDYREVDRDGLKFYLEQGAGIGPMLEPFSLIDGRPIRRYLEIGCSFGFAMDYARRMLGWEVRGFDPGAIAAAGRDLLGLPIETRFFDADDGLHDTADLVYCSEVIEHIPEPQRFVALLRQAVNPDGLLLLTTPNGGSLEPGLSQEAMLPILSTGHHVVLYDRRSIESLLRAAGFRHVRVTEAGHQLRVAASDQPFEGGSACFTPALLRDYLARAAAAAELADDALYVGLLGRLLTEEVNAARFAEAGQPLARLSDIYGRRYGIELDAPAAIAAEDVSRLTFHDFGRRYPYNLTAALYCRGIIQLLAESDPATAAESLAAAARFGRALRARLKTIGADDLHTAALCRAAEIARLEALARCAPSRAVAALVQMQAAADTEDAPAAGHLAQARAALFGHLVNLGAHAQAQRLAAEKGEPLDALLSHGSAPGICAFGLHLLDREQDFDAARDVLACLWEHGEAFPQDGAVRWTARFHQGLAARYAGDPAAARTIAEEIATPPAALPPVPAEIAARIGELTGPSC